MGQTAPADFQVYVTKKQREIAGGILKRSPWLVPAIRPMEEGKEILEVEDKLIDPLEEVEVESQPWRVRKGPQTDESLFFGFIPYSRS
jgi:hypothetical protein